MRVDVLMALVVVFLIFMLLVVIVLPINEAARQRAKRMACVYNLKQVGLAARIWEGDNNNKYPMAVSVTNGGGMELAVTGNAAVIFQVMSNKLATSRVLICPADDDHTFATNFQNDFNSSHISYFVNPDASETYPQMIMFGDDNLATNGVPVGSGLLTITPTTLVSWTSARHKYCGNIAFADGSVAEESNQSMTNWVGGTDFTNRIAIP
jgi:prepilin-type processing-associated H-X9-DG protein